MKRSPFSPVKIGVVGLGNFGRQHALTVAGIAEAELVGVVARRQASLDAFSEQLPGIPGWLDLSRALAESDAEAWVVASSTPTHVAITKQLLEAGKTVLLEKPLAVTLADAETLAPLVQADSRNLMLAHIVLFNTEFLQLRDEVRRRGSLSHIHCVRHRPAVNLEKFPGENPMVLTMVHDLYAVQSLVNRAEPVQFTSQAHTSPKGECDLVLAQLRFADGMLAAFVASFMTPAGMAPNGYDRMEVFGSGWMGRIEPNPRPIAIWDDKARWPLPLEIRADPSGPTGMMAAELRCFCRVVRRMEPVPVGATYADAMQVQRWMDRLEAAFG